MSLSDDVDLEELVMTKDDLSGADIKAVCSECLDLGYAERAAEAGLLALRERRMRVNKAVSQCGNFSLLISQDFTTAREKVLYRKDENTVSEFLEIVADELAGGIVPVESFNARSDYTCHYMHCLLNLTRTI